MPVDARLRAAQALENNQARQASQSRRSQPTVYRGNLTTSTIGSTSGNRSTLDSSGAVAIGQIVAEFQGLVASMPAAQSPQDIADIQARVTALQTKLSNFVTVGTGDPNADAIATGGKVLYYDSTRKRGFVNVDEAWSPDGFRSFGEDEQIYEYAGDWLQTDELELDYYTGTQWLRTRVCCEDEEDQLGGGFGDGSPFNGSPPTGDGPEEPDTIPPDPSGNGGTPGPEPISGGSQAVVYQWTSYVVDGNGNLTQPITNGSAGPLVGPYYIESVNAFNQPRWTWYLVDASGNDVGLRTVQAGVEVRFLDFDPPT